MPVLEIITIGTELLLGEITDTNSTYIARTLRDHGIDIFRITTIGDNPKRIASTIKEALQRAEIIITTGGLGPTVDDPTRQAVAEGTDHKLVFMPDLWEDIVNRFKSYHRQPTINNQRQAYIPEGAIPIKNPVGTAPSFIVEMQDSCVISLPGVPSEMKYLLHHEIIPYLLQKFSLKSQTIKASVLHTASIGESAIDEHIGDLEEQANPTVGLLAHPGQVDIRITAKAGSGAEALAIIQPTIDKIMLRLEKHVYGKDDQTLPGVIFELLEQAQAKLTIWEYGVGERLLKLQDSWQGIQFEIKSLARPALSLEGLEQYITKMQNPKPGEIKFGISLDINQGVVLYMVYVDSNKIIPQDRFYGGPPDHAPLWAFNCALEFLRQQLLGIQL